MLSDDPYKSFEMFQGRIRDEYLMIVNEDDLHVIDATLLISEQQETVRQTVQPYLEDSMLALRISYGELINEEGGHRTLYQ